MYIRDYTRIKIEHVLYLEYFEKSFKIYGVLRCTTCLDNFF
jgi:hypothetical protein